MKTILIKTQIAAPPARVWALIADFAGYGAWNPFVTAIAGEQRKGGKLRLTVELGGRTTTIRARVTAWRPGETLRWMGGIPVLFRAEHFLTIEPSGDGTQLCHGEYFRGPIPALLPDRLFDRMRPDYASLNAALKARAEAAA